MNCPFNSELQAEGRGTAFARATVVKYHGNHPLEIIEGSNIVEDLDRYREVMTRGGDVLRRETERERISYERSVKT